MALKQGSITTNGGSVVLDLDNAGLVSVELSGTWTGVVKPQVSDFGTNWEDVQFIQPTDAYRLASANSNESFICKVAGYHLFRVLSTSWSSGQLDIALKDSHLFYDWAENYNLRIASNLERSSSGTDTMSLVRNPFYAQTGIYLHAQTVTSGPIAVPVIKVYNSVLGNTYQVAQFGGSGTIDTGDKKKYLIGRGCSGGLWDEVASFALTRDTLIEVVWTLSGGDAVTFDLDITQTR